MGLAEPAVSLNGSGRDSEAGAARHGGCVQCPPVGMAIVVLAAGLGTRFGGLKQLAPVGPAGEALLDYTIHDAAAAGFDRVVLVVRSEIEQQVREHVERFARVRTVVTVCQDGHGRRRPVPWGTAHALLACRNALTTPFAVVNADDLYGAESLRDLGEYLRSPAFGPGHAVLVGYQLRATLSSSGGVSRGVCELAPDGTLRGIVEHTGVHRSAGRIVSDQSTELAPDTPVSMNLWGFDPSVLDDLEPRIEAFYARHADDKAEYRIPDAVDELVERGLLRVTVVPTEARWVGITYPEDLDVVRADLAELVEGGTYPEALDAPQGLGRVRPT